MKLEGYENRFVAFIDILGFKQLVENMENEKDGYGKDFKRIKSVLNFLQEESVESNGSHDLRIYESCDEGFIERELGDPRITYVSDCVIISTDGTFDGFKSLCNKVTKFSTDLAFDGIFLRGGITYGPIYHHGAMLFGSAYQNAFTIESEYAKYPRIVIDKTVYEFLKDKVGTFPLSEPTIVTDLDGQYYLSNFPWYYFPYYAFSWISFLIRVRGKIIYYLNLFDTRVSKFSPQLKELDNHYCWKESYTWNLDFSGGNNKVLDKYVWLKDEFNKTIDYVYKFYNKEKLHEFYNNQTKEGISKIEWKNDHWGETDIPWRKYERGDFQKFH